MSPKTSEPKMEDEGRSDSSMWVENSRREHWWTCAPVVPEVRDFHRGLPGYKPTRLTDLPDLAGEFGVGHVFAKDESNRFGLPAFKALGASWAVHRALLARTGADVGRPATMVAATDGNHGRAVARFALHFGHRAYIFVPDDVHPAAVQAIRDEGADVTVVSGSYDDAVATAAAHVEDSTDVGVDKLLVQDTSWPGYEEVPGWVVDGYSTLFAEIDDQLGDRGISGPDLVVVPTGVGSLLQAALTHYRSDPARLAIAVAAVEPTGAACVFSSVTAGRPVDVDTGHTVMAGLNCGTMSSLAWPHVRRGLDFCVTVTDSEAMNATRELEALEIAAGPCGAAPLAALRVLHGAQEPGEGGRRRSPLTLSPDATIVLLVTEGAEANPWGRETGGPG